MLRPKPVAEDVREYRDRKETSMQEAKDALMKQWRHQALQDIINSPQELKSRFNDLLVLVANIPGF